jgi:general secretion pathway protein J
MLVALVVFGLVMAGLAQSYRFGLTAWRADGPAATAPESLAASAHAVTGMIEQAIPGSLTGKPGGLSFTTRLPEGAGYSGLSDVALQLAPGDQFQLSYRKHPAGIPLLPPAPRATAILLRGVNGVSFSYYSGEGAATPGWTSSWEGQGLPVLIRLHLRFVSGQQWPDLIIAPAPGGG